MRRVLGAAALLLLFALASWLPAFAREEGSHHAPLDLARPALPTPPWQPLVPPSAAAAVRDMLAAVGVAVAAAAPGPPPYGGDAAAPGEGAPLGPAAGAPTSVPPAALDAFTAAYAYLSPAWRARLPFPAFVASWQGVRSLEPLAVLPAGPPRATGSTARIFVELRLLLHSPALPGAWQYRYGFYTAERVDGSWKVRDGMLQVEPFAAPPADPGSTALAAARHFAAQHGQLASSHRSVQLTAGKDHILGAYVQLGDQRYAVNLYQLVDGSWLALCVRRV